MTWSIPLSLFWVIDHLFLRSRLNQILSFHVCLSSACITDRQNSLWPWPTDLWMKGEGHPTPTYMVSSYMMENSVSQQSILLPADSLHDDEANTGNRITLLFRLELPSCKYSIFNHHCGLQTVLTSGPEELFHCIIQTICINQSVGNLMQYSLK